MSQLILYAAIGAGIACVFFILFKLFSGRERKSKAYSLLKGQQPFAQATELFDPSLETKKHIRSATTNFSMIGDIIPMLEAGDKLSAIKHVHEKEHMSLHDAKVFVDQAEDVMHRMPALFNFKENGKENDNNNENKETFNSTPSSIDTRIRGIMEGGNFIAAIKVYREETNCSLAEAKEYCEEFARKNNLLR